MRVRKFQFNCPIKMVQVQLLVIALFEVRAVCGGSSPECSPKTYKQRRKIRLEFAL